MSSVAFAGYHEYSGGANNYFDTRSLDRVGTSWSYARDECTSSATERDSPYASPHKSKVVSGSTALSNELTVWGGDSVTLTFKSGANNYSSAKLRLSAISSYGYFYAVGQVLCRLIYLLTSDIYERRTNNVHSHTVICIAGILKNR